jgi:hypothetical protein
MRRVLVVTIAALAVVAASAATAPAARPLPCTTYVKQHIKLVTNPPSVKCVQEIHSRWLDCLIKAYDDDRAINSLTCFKLRWATIDAYIYNKTMKRIQRRNGLIDVSGTLEDLCSADDPAVCSDLDRVEREIRKLAP